MRRRSMSEPEKETTRNAGSGMESPLLPHIGYLSDAEEEEGLRSERLSARVGIFRLREHRNSTVAPGSASKALGSLLGIKVPSPSFGLSGFEAPTIARFFVTRVGLFRDQKRILAFTKDRMYVVRMDTGFAKGTYPVQSSRLVPLNEKSYAGNEKFELRSDLKGIKQVYRSKVRSALLHTFFDIQDKASRDIVDRLYHAIKRPRQSSGVMLNVVLRVGPGSIETINPGDLKRNLRAPISVLTITRILHRVKDRQCLLLECKGGAFHEYLTLERDSISRAICDTVQNLGEIPPPIIMSDEFSVYFPSDFITRAVGIILKLEWGEERAYEMVPSIFATSVPEHIDRKSSALFHFWSANALHEKEKNTATTGGCKESGGDVKQASSSSFGCAATLLPGILIPTLLTPLKLRARGNSFNLVTTAQAQWLFFSNLLSTACTVRDRHSMLDWGLQTHHPSDGGGASPDSVALMELLAEVNATLLPYHFRAKEVGPPSLKAAATALLWLIQPEVLKHFSSSEMVSLLQAALRFVGRGAEEASAQTACSTILHILRSEREHNPVLCFAAALLLREIVAPLKFLPSIGRLQDNNNHYRRHISALGKKLFSPSTNNCVAEDRLHVILSVCFPERVKASLPSPGRPTKASKAALVGELRTTNSSASTIDCMSATKAVLLEIVSYFLSNFVEGGAHGNFIRGSCSSIGKEIQRILNEADPSFYDIIIASTRSPFVALASSASILLRCLVTAARGCNHPRKMGMGDVVDSDKLRVLSRQSGQLLWCVLLASDAAASNVIGEQSRLLLKSLCHYSATEGRHNAACVSRSFPPGLLIPQPESALHDEYGVPVGCLAAGVTPWGWGNSRDNFDHIFTGWNNRVLGGELRTAEVIWTRNMREELVYRIRAELQALDDKQARLAGNMDNREGCPLVPWNDIVWQIPWHDSHLTGGQVKVGRYFLLPLQEACDDERNGTRFVPPSPALLCGFFGMCLQRLSVESEASVVELILDTMCIVLRCVDRRSAMVASTNFEGLALPSLRGIVNLVEDGFPLLPEEGYKGAAYLSSVRYLRCGISFHPGNARLFLTMNGIKAVLKVMRSVHVNICYYFKGIVVVDSKKGGTMPEMTATRGRASDGEALKEALKESVDTMAECLLCLNTVWKCVGGGHGKGNTSPYFLTGARMPSLMDDEGSMRALMVLLAELLEIGCCCSSKDDSEEEEEVAVSVLVKPALQLLAWVVGHERSLLYRAARASKEGEDESTIAEIIEIQMRIVCLLLDMACRGIHPTLCAEVLAGEVLSPPLPVLGLCGRGRALADNLLSRFIPGAMIRLLLTEGPKQFARVLCLEEGNCGHTTTHGLQTPTLWWNEECRRVLSEIITTAKPQYYQFTCHNGEGGGGEMVLKDPAAVRELYERKGGMPRPYIVPFFVSQLRVGTAHTHVGPDPTRAVKEFGVEATAAEFISECATAFSNFTSLQHMESSFSVATMACSGNNFVKTVSSPISSVREVTQLTIRLLKFLPPPCEGRTVVISNNLARAVRSVINPLLEAATAIVALIHHRTNSEQAHTGDNGGFEKYHCKASGDGPVGLLPNDRVKPSRDFDKLSPLEELEIALERLMECVSVAVRIIEPRGELVAAVKATQDDEQQYETEKQHHFELFCVVPVALNKAGEVLRCFKQLGRMASVVDLMKSINFVLRSIAKRDERIGGAMTSSDNNICGLGDLITTMIEFLSLNGTAPPNGKPEFPGVRIVAQEGLHLATEIVGRQAVSSTASSSQDDENLLLEPLVHVSLLTRCLQWSPNCRSDDPCKTLSETAARALQALANSGNKAEMHILSLLLTPGLVSVLQQSPETFLMVASGSGGTVRCPHVVWTACMKQELHEFLRDVASQGKLLADMPSFCFSSLRDDPIVGGINVRSAIERSNPLPTAAIGMDRAAHHSLPECSPPTAAALAVKALCLPFPSNLLEMIFNRLCDDVEVFLEMQEATPPTQSSSLHIVKHMDVCLRAVLGLALGTEDGMQWIVTSENNRRRMWLVWELLPPSTEPSNLGAVASQVHRSIIQLAHSMADHEDSREGYYSGNGLHLLESSGIACPLLCLSSYLLRCGKAEGCDLAVGVFRVMSGMARASERFATHLVSAGAIPWIICCLSGSSVPTVTRRECAILLSTFVKGDKVNDGKDGRPRGEAGVVRVLPEPLVAHLESDQLGTSILKLLDDKISAPTLMWDSGCRDVLHEMCCRLWTGWRSKLMSAYFNSSSHHHCIPPTSARWTVDDLPDKYPVPGGAEREPCIAGLYFRVFCRQPGFKLQEAHVLTFLVTGSRELGSLDLSSHRPLASDLMHSLFCALSTLSPKSLAIISRAGGQKLWPNVFSVIFNEMANTRLIAYGAQIMCLLLAVPGHDCPWNEVGAAMQFEHHGGKATAQLLGSQVIDDQSLQFLLMAIQAVVASQTKEAMHATYSAIATPEVFRVLVSRLSTFSATTEEAVAASRRGGIDGHHRGQVQRHRKKSSIFFNKGPSILKGGKADGGGGPSGSINHHRGSIGGTTISLATRTEFAVLTLLSNLCIHGIGGLVTRRYLTEHSHHGVMDALQSMKVISDREERKQEIFAMLQGVVPHVEEFHKLYVPAKPVTGYHPTPLPRILQCLPRIDGSLFSQKNMVRRKSILGPQIVFSPPPPPLPPSCNVATVVVNSPGRNPTEVSPLPLSPCKVATAMVDSPRRRIPTRTSQPLPSRHGNVGRITQQQHKPRILMERVGLPTSPSWPSPRTRVTKTIEPLESPIRRCRISPQ